MSSIREDVWKARDRVLSGYIHLIIHPEARDTHEKHGMGSPTLMAGTSKLRGRGRVWVESVKGPPLLLRQQPRASKCSRVNTIDYTHFGAGRFKGRSIRVFLCLFFYASFFMPCFLLFCFMQCNACPLTSLEYHDGGVHRRLHSVTKQTKEHLVANIWISACRELIILKAFNILDAPKPPSVPEHIIKEVSEAPGVQQAVCCSEMSLWRSRCCSWVRNRFGCNR